MTSPHRSQLNRRFEFTIPSPIARAELSTISRRGTSLSSPDAMQKRPLASPAGSFRRSAARQRRVFTAPPTSAAPQRSQPPRSRSATDMMSSEDDEELFITPPAPAFPSRGSDRHDYSPAVSPGPPGAPRGRGLPARSRYDVARARGRIFAASTGPCANLSPSHSNVRTRSLPRPVRPPSLSSLSLGIPTALPPSQQYADEASDGEGDGDYYESRTW